MQLVLVVCASAFVLLLVLLFLLFNGGALLHALASCNSVCSQSRFSSLRLSCNELDDKVDDDDEDDDDDDDEMLMPERARQDADKIGQDKTR